MSREAAQYWGTSLVYVKACAQKQTKQNGVQTTCIGIHWLFVVLQKWMG